MSEAIAVINAGSSSLKFSVCSAQDLSLQLHGKIEGLGEAPRALIRSAEGKTLLDRTWQAGSHGGDDDHEEALAFLLKALPPLMKDQALIAFGHRIVHGGEYFREPALLDEVALARLDTLVSLAPLHQPHNLTPVRALRKLMPGLPQVGCFDTAFHATNPAVSRRFALPRELHEAGVMRYGFHGLSYEYIASMLPRFDARAAQGRTVVLHLGNGASMCGLIDGRSVASTMGFTALDGLPMGTRCGNIDPGALIWLMDERGMDARAIERLLYKESGLLGVSGLSSDMRTLLASDAPAAKEAVDLYVYRISRELGSLAAALGGLDAVVFTAGIGENAAEVRERVCQSAAWLGLELDVAGNRSLPALEDGDGRRISTDGSRVAAWVIPTDEEGMIARHTRRVVQGH